MARWSLNIQVRGGSLRELVRRDLASQLDQFCGPDAFEGELRDERLNAASREYDAINLTPSGLVVSFSRFSYGFCILDSTIPYSKLEGILRTDLIP